MSIHRKYYVIAGYDLTGFETDKYEDWKWSQEGEEYTCNPTKGEIQLFDDLMCGEYLYFGYVFASGDQYDFGTAKFTASSIERQKPYVAIKLNELIKLGVISKEVYDNIEHKYQIIVFEECT